MPVFLWAPDEEAALKPPARWPASETLDSLKLLPLVAWDAGLHEAWVPGEVGARTQLERFSAAAILDYRTQRDHPDRPSTSRLSPHLHFGEIGPRQVWHAARRAAEHSGIDAATWRKWQFLAEIGWREFAHHLLFHYPHTPDRPLRSAFEKFPWRTDPGMLMAWKKGRTGVPLVDAGMRELGSTGWMHNRVPEEHIHALWDAPPLVLREAGVTPGRNYPDPVVSLNASRIAALAAFARTR